MDHFKLIGSISHTPLRDAVASRPFLFLENTFRQDFANSPHKDTQSILLRWPYLRRGIDMIDELENHDGRVYDRLPEVRPIVRDLMFAVAGERLGRVMVVRLKPGGRVTPHIDEGKSPNYYDRLVVPLNCIPGNLMHFEDQPLYPEPGHAYWINNRVLHWSVNESPEPRDLLIIDIKTPYLKGTE